MTPEVLLNVEERVLVGAVVDPASPATIPPERLPVIERHQLAPLAWHVLTTSGHAHAWPPDLQLALRRAAAAQALLTDRLDNELRRVLRAAAEAGVPTVVIKGAALASTHYPHSHLRPRSDSDVVIRQSDRETMFAVLRTLGYRQSDAVDGDLITQQAQWTRTIEAGILHAVDLHWRVFNPHLFGEVLTVERLFERALPVAPLGSHALAPCPADTLVLACVHRFAHHPGEDDPIWDFDIHLLLSSMTDSDAEEVHRIGVEGDLGALIGTSIASAHSRFRTRVPAPLTSLPEAASGRSEISSAFLDPGRSRMDLLASDLAALGSWRARARLLGQHLFPSPAYMRSKYRLRHSMLLPLAYAHRIVAGVPRWLRSQRS